MLNSKKNYFNHNNIIKYTQQYFYRLTDHFRSELLNLSFFEFKSNTSINVTHAILNVQDSVTHMLYFLANPMNYILLRIRCISTLRIILL